MSLPLPPPPPPLESNWGSANNDPDWELAMRNAQLELDIPSKPDILTVMPADENQLLQAIDNVKTNYFKSGIFSRPNPSEVAVHKTHTSYSPYLVIAGRYIAKFLRHNRYNCKVDSSVSAVKIHNEIFQVDTKAVKISNIAAKVGSGLAFSPFSSGIVSFSCDPLEGFIQKGISRAMGDKDKSLITNKNIVVESLEQAIYENEKILCYDASTASIVERPEFLKRIKKGTRTAAGRPHQQREALDFEKAVYDAQRKTVKEPVGRILEHLFQVCSLSLLFWPETHSVIEYRGERKQLVLDGVLLNVIQ